MMGKIDWVWFVLESNDVVAGLDVGDALSHGFDNTSTFVSEDDGEGTLGILARERVGICYESCKYGKA